MRPNDIFPKPLLEEMRRLAKLPYEWVEMINQDDDVFTCRIRCNTFIHDVIDNAQDLMAIAAGVRWIKAGPKIVRVTEQQYQTLAKVDVNLEVKDLKLPYNEVLVVMPPGHLQKCVLICKYDESVLICSSTGGDHMDDITTIIRQRDGIFTEASLEKYDDDIAQETAEANTDCLRVALNMLLAMTYYNFTIDYLYQKEVIRDVSLMRSKKSDEVREAASARFLESPQLLTLDRTVILHKVKGPTDRSEPTGKELSFHWRRGHWRMQHYGPLNSLRKRVFIAPIMVRKDLLVNDVTETSTTYRS